MCSSDLDHVLHVFTDHCPIAFLKTPLKRHGYGRNRQRTCVRLHLRGQIPQPFGVAHSLHLTPIGQVDVFLYGLIVKRAVGKAIDGQQVKGVLFTPGTKTIESGVIHYDSGMMREEQEQRKRFLASTHLGDQRLDFQSMAFKGEHNNHPGRPRSNVTAVSQSGHASSSRRRRQSCRMARAMWSTSSALPAANSSVMHKRPPKCSRNSCRASSTSNASNAG